MICLTFDLPLLKNLLTVGVKKCYSFLYYLFILIKILHFYDIFYSNVEFNMLMLLMMGGPLCGPVKTKAVQSMVWSRKSGPVRGPVQLQIGPLKWTGPVHF